MATRTRNASKSVSRGNLDGVGATLAEARADLNRQIDNAVTGYYTPHVVSFAGHHALVTREPHGWGYKILHDGLPATDGVVTLHHGTSIGNSGSPSKDEMEIIRMAIRHLVSSFGGDYHTAADLPAMLDARDGADILRGCRYQRAYRHARAAHPDWTAGQIHQWGGDNVDDPMFA